jgi:Domain of unknown function (DUF4034)
MLFGGHPGARAIFFFSTFAVACLAAHSPVTLAGNSAVTSAKVLQNGGAPPIDDADSQPANAFRTTVRNLFNEEKFDELDELAGNVRAQKSRFLGGGWKLNALYSVLQGPGSLTATDAVWNAHIESLQRWIAQKPGSITPRIALADAYIRFAWKARGNGLSNTVTSDGWKLFTERIAQAQQTLEAADSLSIKDPHWYRSMEIVALAQGWDRSRTDSLVQQAIMVEPDYFYIYGAYTNFLLPKWYGRSGEAEAFAASAADRVGGQEGDFVYFKIVSGLNCCKRQPQMQNISWDRVKQGFAALEQLYDSTNFEKNAMAFMAARQGDREFTQQLFDSIGDNWDEQVWRSKAEFDRAKTSLALGD